MATTRKTPAPKPPGRAKAASGGAKPGQKQTIQAKGKPAVTFKAGGLHESVGVPQGEKIPAAKIAAAKRGDYGPKAARQASLAAGMLAAGRKTAARNRGKKRS